MLYLILKISIISLLLIFLVHHLINFFKSTLTVPKIKDLVNNPTKKYENMYNIIKSQQGISNNYNYTNDANDINDTNDTNDTNNTNDTKKNNKKEGNDTISSEEIPPKQQDNKNIGVTNMVHSMLKKEDNTNGWDHEANLTITNWYNLFKQQSFIYQWVLDRNRKMADRLATISIIASSMLGIFSAFKLWIDNNVLFQTISNIILMFFNFGVALITSLSKKYVDNQKNESIRTYVEEVDSFLGELAAQVLKAPVYRMNADKFFKLNNDKYTKLVSCAPNLSITDLALGKKEYKKYSAECTNV